MKRSDLPSIDLLGQNFTFSGLLLWHSMTFYLFCGIELTLSCSFWMDAQLFFNFFFRIIVMYWMIQDWSATFSEN